MNKEQLNSKDLIIKNKVVSKTKKKNVYIKDLPSKKLLIRKDIVSYILKYLVPEYKDIDIKDIKDSLVSGKDDKHIKTLSSKDNSINDATIVYDVLFTVKPPNSNENILMYIDIEPQGAYKLSYPIVSRAIYYASRLIDRQKGKEFNNQDYGLIKKVYSIWLNACIDNDNKVGSINSYTFKEDILSGKYLEDKSNYDLINIIIAYISNNNIDKQYKTIMELLYLIFKDSDTSKEDKLNIIKNEYDIIDIDEELKEMCSFEEGVRQTIREETYIKTATEIVFNCMESFNVTLQQALDSLKIEEDIRESVIKEINKITSKKEIN